MLESLSIKKIALAVSAACSAVVAATIAIALANHLVEVDAFFLLVTFAVSMALIYLVTFFLLRKFLAEKLSIIYKIMRKSQVRTGSSTGATVDLTNIDKVNTDVLKWASDTEQRIRSLQTLSDYRKNFVGNVSHELKTPIFSLQGYLHTLLDGGIYDKTINLKYIKRAAENADRLQHIVEDLESIGAMESGQMDLDIETFDLYAVVRSVFLDLKKVAEQSQISLSIRGSSDLPLLVKGDLESIRQVITNLVNNSIKYGEEGGKITVSAFDLEKNVLIEVADDGIGIEEKHLEHLFDRFYRVDTSRSRQKGGSGLGLSIVKHIIEAHGQNINIRSTLGEGSTVGFTLAKG